MVSPNKWVKFDPDNPGPGEFNNPHSIAISADRRIFVIDRGNERLCRYIARPAAS